MAAKTKAKNAAKLSCKLAEALWALFKSFIRRAYERVIDPLVEKNLKKLPPRSRPPKEGDSSVL